MNFKLIVSLLLITAIIPSLVNSASITSCSIKTTCSSNEISLLRTSSVYNAHAELISSPVNYGYNVCCSGTDLVNDASGPSEAAFLQLYSPTNSHVSTNNDYSNPAYLGVSVNDYSVSCSQRTSCLATETCIVSVSGSTNAHVSDCTGLGAYNDKICCSITSSTIPTPTGSCILSESFWSQDTTKSNQYANNERVMNKTVVNMVLTSSGCTDINVDETHGINFTVWYNDCTSTNSEILVNNLTGIPSCQSSGTFVPVYSSKASLINNQASAIWEAEYRNFGELEPKYFFVATLINTYNATLSNNIRVNNTNTDVIFPCVGCSSIPSTCFNGRKDSGEVCDGNSCGVGYTCYNCRACVSTGIGALTTSSSTICKDDGGNDQYGTYTVNITTTYQNGSRYSSTTTKRCVLPKEVVPFFSWFNMLITLALIASFYIITYKRKKNN